MSSATDELRAMLDERGVEHYDHDPNPEYSTPYSTRDTEWSNDAKRNVLYQEWPNGTTRLGASNVSPAQAIAATLRTGTCQLKRASWDDGTCTWGCICSACDAHLEHETGIGYNYCPVCGAKVVDE